MSRHVGNSTINTLKYFMFLNPIHSFLASLLFFIYTAYEDTLLHTFFFARN